MATSSRSSNAIFPIVVENVDEAEDDSAEVQDLSSELESTIFFTNNTTHVPKITDHASFERKLPGICDSIFDMLPSRKNERQPTNGVSPCL